ELVVPRVSTTKYNSEWGALANVWGVAPVRVGRQWELSSTVGAYLRLRREIYVEALVNHHALAPEWGRAFTREGVGVRVGAPFDESPQIALHVWSRGDSQTATVELVCLW